MKQPPRWRALLAPWLALPAAGAAAGHAAERGGGPAGPAALVSWQRLPHEWDRGPASELPAAGDGGHAPVAAALRAPAPPAAARRPVSRLSAVSGEAFADMLVAAVGRGAGQQDDHDTRGVLDPVAPLRGGARRVTA
ncbi:unnamed protein product [Prorocentrum cordatum]|uniref:Phospholipase B-like n=1 Tax=Prorocentrum cordatum TaxID=2364126 RepID=A0ABN9PZ35_9DINO|nr:unnamed protein product [Polarella glacialis]